jgi:cytosine/adenosine deaminase-related metal-dependent hydrolase
MLERIAKALTMAHEAGATFLMGTDSGFAATPFGEWHARELELLCSLAGLSPLEAIKSATSNAAFAFDQEGTLGQISEGAVADVLIVDGDPLSDIRVLQDKERLTVIQGGAVVAFTPEAEDPDRRWSHDRAMTITRDLITQDAVRAYEEGVPVPDRPASPLYSTRDEAGEMVRQFDQLGREARLPE